MTEQVVEEGHIYVLGFSDNTVKVGRTTDPKARLLKHRATSRQDNAEMVSQWVSVQHGNSDQTEALLIEFCRKHGRKHRGNEWFSGVPYEKVLTYAKALELAPSQKTCYCGQHVVPADCQMPHRHDLEGFMRRDLGLLSPPLFEMSFPTGWKHVHQMSKVEKLVIRWETAQSDVKFLSALLIQASEILHEIGVEIMRRDG